MKRSTIKEILRPLVKKILQEIAVKELYPLGMATWGHPDKIKKAILILQRSGIHSAQMINPSGKREMLAVPYEDADKAIKIIDKIFPMGVKEASSTAGGAAGPYQTPYAFSGGFDKKHHTIATQLGYKETNASADEEDREQVRVNKNKMRTGE